MSEFETFTQDEWRMQMPKPELEVTKLTDGLGFGHGGISHQERKQMLAEAGTNVEELLSTVEAGIQSPNILVEVDKDKNGQMLDDDGCGDGRGWKRVFEGFIEKFKSLNRSKVFGGGMTMAAAAEVGLGSAKGKTVNGLFKSALGRLKDRLIGFGAHTDDHPNHNHGEGCGCGAIDLAPQIIQNAVKYKEEIRSSVEALGASTNGLDTVENNYQEYAEEIKDQSYSGKKAMDEVKQSGKIVKELGGEHREMYIIINTVPGHTVDQEYIRNLSHGLVHVFAFDVPRMQDIAMRAYDDQDEQQKAFLGELVYTLSVAGTLTTGDLPVYVISKVTESEPVTA